MTKPPLTKPVRTALARYELADPASHTLDNAYERIINGMKSWAADSVISHEPYKKQLAKYRAAIKTASKSKVNSKIGLYDRPLYTGQRHTQKHWKYLYDMTGILLGLPPKHLHAYEALGLRVPK